MSYKTYIPFAELELPCTGERKTFTSNKTLDMWIKLHKKKCECCRNSSTQRFVPTRTDMVRINHHEYTNGEPIWDAINAIRF